MRLLDSRQLSRRALLAGGLGCVACQRPGPPRDGKIHLRFTSWGSQAEMDSFREIIRRYQALHPKVAIDLEEISYRTQSSIDVQLAAGIGPDLFRVEYTNVGRYSPSGAIIDLSQYLPPDFGDDFTAPVWAAVQFEGKPHALPLHTDTSVILYNKSLFSRLGIQPPEVLQNSWSWAEFIQVSRTLKKVCDYAFAVNWTFGGSFRWLNFLYQHGGHVLNAAGDKCLLRSQAALDTLRWTRQFFSERFVPLSDSAQSTEEIENLFNTGVVGMYFDVGPQGMRDMGSTMDWGATFLPQDVARASELGGNAVAVSRDCKHPDVAADFAIFITNEENMREFVLAAEFLPVRKSLLNGPLPYKYAPLEMEIHLQQATTVPVQLARVVTMPGFPRVSRSLGDELDLAFTGGQAPEVSLERISRAVERSLHTS